MQSPTTRYINTFQLGTEWNDVSTALLQGNPNQTISMLQTPLLTTNNINIRKSYDSID